jgi:predicted SnoaL-like aldol condensation-catalyzing enzyme
LNPVVPPESSLSDASPAATVRTRETLEGLFAAWRNGDALRAGAYFAAGARYAEVRHEPILGRDAIVAHFTTFFRDGPVWDFTVEDTVVDGERAAVRYRFAVVGEDGSWRELSGCAFVRLVDGTIGEWREYEG